MSAPKRIQLRRSKGWRKPEGAVVVTRPGKWGNPYHVMRADFDHGWIIERNGEVVSRYDTREQAVNYAIGFYSASLFTGTLAYDTEDVRRELAGKDLCCWCPIGSPCHADVLLRVANDARDA